MHDYTFDKLLTDLFIRAQTWFLFIWKSSVETPKVFTIRHPHKYVSRRQELTWSNISNSYTFNICFIPNTYVQSVYAWLFVHHCPSFKVNLHEAIWYNSTALKKFAKIYQFWGQRHISTPEDRKTDNRGVLVFHNVSGRMYIPEARAQNYSVHEISSQHKALEYHNLNPYDLIQH